ncbi:flagellar hook-associated protein FlgL [Pontibacillus marinus]|uniref:Flagellar hook-associated protein FlgL n=1 Tax=Pontibacillus marinus BH030004 = DSM 16465 TaxID=1385511 RepID=A0A0A5G6R7_9BACI|nr:flagellar hook-associated protein FlgL [Pontibacillus marinus]KGX86795.1 flagellar hook-associated protein FlgL [Pontibacillus marinus BH030004 = DSM 16465]
MRVTQSMLTNNMLRNVSKSYERMGKYQEQLSTGKKIQKPSDDPVVAMRGMNYRSELTEIKQYQRNLNEVHNWMDNSDAAMDKATKALQRIRELAVQGSNGTYEEGQRENIAKEVKQLKQHLTDVANTKVNDKYIFNGTNTTEKPVNFVDGAGNVIKNPDGSEKVSTSTNGNEVKIEVSKGVEIATNVNPTQVFKEGMFDDIDKFINRLEGTGSGELDHSIADIDKHINSVVNERADLGARMNRVELIEDRLSSQEVITSGTLSENEDAELEKVITELKTQESVHRAALGVGARIIQPSLMDFLR